MILDRLDRAARYEALYPNFRAAFDFLRSIEPMACPEGRVPLAGERLYAIHSRDQGRGRAASPLEAHRRYVDIQYVLEGDEWMGWAGVTDELAVKTPYDNAKDIVFFEARPASWFQVPPGCFAIFFPEDGHAPLAGDGPVHKMVVKVAV